MTQDIGVPLFEGFKEIYRGKTPNKVFYPGNVCIEWTKFECEFEYFLKKNDVDDKAKEFSSICLVSYGDIAYPKDRVSLEFQLFGITQNGYIPCDRDIDSIPNGYISLCKSSDWIDWNEFVTKLDSTDKSAVSGNEIWQEQLEEQYFVSTLRALRRVLTGNFKTIYSGYFGETAEEWINRTTNLPENV